MPGTARLSGPGRGDGWRRCTRQHHPPFGSHPGDRTVWPLTSGDGAARAGDGALVRSGAGRRMEAMHAAAPPAVRLVPVRPERAGPLTSGDRAARPGRRVCQVRGGATDGGDARGSNTRRSARTRATGPCRAADVGGPGGPCRGRRVCQVRGGATDGGDAGGSTTRRSARTRATGPCRAADVGGPGGPCRGRRVCQVRGGATDGGDAGGSTTRRSARTRATGACRAADVGGPGGPRRGRRVRQVQGSGRRV